MTNQELIRSLNPKDLENRKLLAETFNCSNKKELFKERVFIPMARKENISYDEDAEVKNTYPFERGDSNEIVLNEVEKQSARMIGRIRYAQNIFIKGMGDGIADSYHQGEMFHVYGAFAEMAGSKFLGIFPDLDFENRFAILGLDKGDGTYQDMAIDWKSARTGDIVIKAKKKTNKIDLYGGIKKLRGSYTDLSQEMAFECVGFISHEEVFSVNAVKSNIKVSRKNLKTIDTYICPSR
jgi:hypothetical protein